MQLRKYIANTVFHFDQPPVGVRVIRPDGLPQHLQVLRKSNQADNRWLTFAATPTLDQALCLVGLDVQPDLAAQRARTGFIRLINRLFAREVDMSIHQRGSYQFLTTL